MQKSKELNRVYYIDNLKVFLTVLVILHHLAIVFGGEGGFIITAPSSSLVTKLLLTVFLALNQSYFMGVFFFISGYFSFKSLKRHGKGKFVKNKLKRLITPALIYYFIISPLINLSIDFFYKEMMISSIKYRAGFGALWFVFALGCFDIIYALAFKCDEKKEECIKRSKIIKVVIFTGICAWVVRIIYPVGTGILGFQLGHFPQYILAYILGVKASRNGWLKSLRTEGIIEDMFKVLICILLFLSGVSLSVYVLRDIRPAFGGANLISFMYSIWEQSMFVLVLILLFKVFKRHFNGTNPILKFASNASYLAYIIHSGVIAVTVMVFTQINMPYIVFCMIATVVSVVISFTGANILKNFIDL